jgi:hypothetical protein
MIKFVVFTSSKDKHVEPSSHIDAQTFGVVGDVGGAGVVISGVVVDPITNSKKKK